MKIYKSVQYMYTVYRYVSLHGKKVKVWLEETPQSDSRWSPLEPICIWSRNKKRATLVSPISALHYKKVYKAETIKHTFSLI